MVVYLLHSSKALSRTGLVRVEHYMGWARDGHLAERLLEHQNGHSKAKIVKAFRAQGATFAVGAIWPRGTRDLERRLKALGHYERWCQVCNAWPTDHLARGEPRKNQHRK